MGVAFYRFKSGLISALDLKKGRANYARSLYNFQTTKKTLTK